MTEPAFKIISPVNAKCVGRVRFASGGEIETAVDRAERAFEAWKTLPLSERIDLVLSFVDELSKRSDALAELVTWQIGRPLHDADEMSAFRSSVEDFARLAPTALEARAIAGEDGIERTIVPAPLGLHLAICAWNFPVAMISAIVIPALLAGNVVIFKHAPQTGLIADIVAEAAVASSLPRGVFTTLHMAHSDAERLLGSGRVQSLHFIGSQGGGRNVLAATRGAFVSTALELGGKDPAYVRGDANVEEAARQIVTGAFDNSGQSCCSVERAYVHEEIFEAFLDSASKEASKWKADDPFCATTKMGPLVSKYAADQVRQHIAEAIGKGATLVNASGATHGDLGEAAYLDGQLLVDVDHSMKVMRDETFGPVLPIMRVTSDEEAIELMDDTEYGLTASIWTCDREVALQFASRLEVGTFYQNRCDYADPRLPWGGMRGSGIGRTDGPAAFESVTQARALHLRER